MKLIDEIESAAKLVTISADMPGLVVGNDHDVTAFHFVESPWWPRIKAAIEAGQAMRDRGGKWGNDEDRAWDKAVGR